MIEVTQPKDLARLRRLALSAQGLTQAQPFGRGLAGARKAIEHIGYVQIDTISVVERAHHHVIHSRVPGFKPAMIDRMLHQRDIFEYWSHAAAFLPIKDYRFSLPYKHTVKNGQIHWFKKPDRKLMAELLARIRADGPLRSRDLETASDKRAGWWDWKPAKKALEQLYMQGDLMVSNREGFQKSYDLTERVLPSGIDTTMPSLEEFATHLLDQQLRCHRLISLKGLTYLRRSTDLRQTVKTLVNERLAQKTLEAFKVAGGETFYMETGSFEARLPPTSKRLRVLSPFDNSVIQRDRLKTLFEYDYQIECYVPEAKRRYGYFCLPLLYGDQFVGRMDCKAHRKDNILEIKSLYFEDAVLNTSTSEASALIDDFAKAIKGFMNFQQCNALSLQQVYSPIIEKSLREKLASSVQS